MNFSKSTNFQQPPSESFSIYDDSVPKSIPDTSTPLKKAVIEQEDKIRHDILETGILFDEDGRVLIQQQGKANEVHFSFAELVLFKHKTFTHNHPMGTAFSIQDVIMAIDWELAEIRVVTPLFRYSLKPKAGKTWCSKQELIDMQKLVVNRVNFVINDMVKLNSLSQYYIPHEFSHYQWLNIASVLDLDYRREKS